MNFLVILTGLPASGKSTFATILKRQILKAFPDTPSYIIDIDDIREEIMPNTFIPGEEYKVRKKFLDLIKVLLNKGSIVIADDLNYYSSMRHELKTIASDLNLPYFLVYISTPLEKCLDWNQKRINPIPPEVIKIIHKKFDYFEKYAWDSPHLTLNLAGIIENLEKEGEKFTEYIKNEVSSLTKGKRLQNNPIPKETNIKKTLDLITRKIIGEVLTQKKNRRFKKELLKFRTSFVKLCQTEDSNENEISQKFKTELLKRYNISIE